jgi:chromosomal replication initiator protein
METLKSELTAIANRLLNRFDLQVIAKPEVVSNIELNHIKICVCNFYNLKPEQLDIVTRKREIVQARQIAMHFGHKYTRFSNSHIAKNIGGKDHATVNHARKTVANLIETDRKFRGEIEQIEKMIIKV